MPREDTQAARKPVTRLSGAGLRDAHLRTSVREDLTPTGMVEAEKTGNSKCWRGRHAGSTHTPCRRGAGGAAAVGNRLVAAQKVEPRITTQAAALLKAGPPTDGCTPVLTAALFTTAERWAAPWAGEQIKSAVARDPVTSGDWHLLRCRQAVRTRYSVREARHGQILSDPTYVRSPDLSDP